MLIPKEKRQKFDKKSKKKILIGFCENIKGYRLYDPISKSVVISRDVIVNEKVSESKNFDILLDSDEQKELPSSVGDENEISSSESNEETEENSDNDYNPEDDLLESDSSHDALSEQTEESETLR